MTGDKRDAARAKVERLTLLKSFLSGEDKDFTKVQGEVESLRGIDEERKQQRIAEIEGELSQVQVELEEEEKRNETWKTENQRRRHNYVPLILEVL